MKNTQLLSLGLLLSAGSFLTACSNDDGASDDSPARSTWTLKVKAMKGGNEATTRALSLGGTGGKTLYATWAKGENVYVYYESDQTTHGVLQPDKDNDNWTTLSGNLTGFADEFISTTTQAGGFDITLLFPNKKPITWEKQRGTLTDIAQNFDWAIATVKVIAAKSDNNENKILEATSATFENLQAIVKFTLLQNDGSANGSALPSNPTALTVSYGGRDRATLTSIPTETYTTNGDGVLYVAIPGFENEEVTLTATVGTDTYTYTKSNVAFENGKYYDITVKMTKK